MPPLPPRPRRPGLPGPAAGAVRRPCAAWSSAEASREQLAASDFRREAGRPDRWDQGSGCRWAVRRAGRSSPIREHEQRALVIRERGECLHEGVALEALRHCIGADRRGLRREPLLERAGPRGGPPVVCQALAGRIEKPWQGVRRKVVVSPPRREERLGDDVVDCVGPRASRDKSPYGWVVARKKRREVRAIACAS